MGTEPSHADVLLRQYAMVPKLMDAPVGSDEAMEVLGSILGRDELAEIGDPEMQRSLRAPDGAFATALSRCSDAWRECITQWSDDCGFASAPWWHEVLTMAGWKDRST